MVEAGSQAAPTSSGDEPPEASGPAGSPFAFPLRMLAYLVVIGGVLSTVLRGFYDWLHTTMSLHTATAVHHLMSVFGHSTISGAKVGYRGFTVLIIGECVGIYEIVIFTACVLAYPATWAERAKGLALGTGLILVFNLVRIAALLLVGRHHPTLFDFFHLYFWQTTLILLVAAAWFAWLRLVVRH